MFLARHAHDRRDADGQRRHRNLRRAVDIHRIMFHVDEQPVVAARFADGCDVDRAGEAQPHADHLSDSSIAAWCDSDMRSLNYLLRQASTRSGVDSLLACILARIAIVSKRDARLAVPRASNCRSAIYIFALVATTLIFTRLPMKKPPKIYLIHAADVAMPPIVASFRANWPQARIVNLLEDGRMNDLAADGRLTAAMTQRFVQIGHYCVKAAADAIYLRVPDRLRTR